MKWIETQSESFRNKVTIQIQMYNIDQINTAQSIIYLFYCILKCDYNKTKLNSKVFVQIIEIF